MGALVLALWALLVSLDPAGGAREPGEDGPLGCGGSWGRWAHPAATALSWVGAQRTPPRGRCCPTGKNLSCYQCFKVRSPEFCLPAMCSSTDQVCVSHTLIITLRLQVKTLLSKRCAPRCPNTNIEFKWPSNSGVPSKIVRHCCSKSLCNRAPAPQEGPRALSRGLLLRVSLGLLWVLL
uniref:Lymphocyte antigen 6 family member L n=1 Tax=Bos taurus TaxID=9913 RepID=A0ABI0P4U6_BOVIN